MQYLNVVLCICRAKEQIDSYSSQLNALHDEIAEIRANHKVTNAVDEETLKSNLSGNLRFCWDLCDAKEPQEAEDYGDILRAIVLNLQL